MLLRDPSLRLTRLSQMKRCQVEALQVFSLRTNFSQTRKPQPFQALHHSIHCPAARISVQCLTRSTLFSAHLSRALEASGLQEKQLAHQSETRLVGLVSLDTNPCFCNVLSSWTLPVGKTARNTVKHPSIDISWGAEITCTT